MKISESDKSELSRAYKKLLAEYIEKEYSNVGIECWVKQRKYNQVHIKTIAATEKTYEVKEYKSEPTNEFTYSHLLAKCPKPMIPVKVSIEGIYVFRTKLKIEFEGFTEYVFIPMSIMDSINTTLHKIEHEIYEKMNKTIFDAGRFDIFDKYIVEHVKTLHPFHKCYFLDKTE